MPDSAERPQVVPQHGDADPAEVMSALVCLRAGNPLTVEQQAVLVAALLPSGRLLADGLRSVFAAAVPAARRLTGRVQSGLYQFAKAVEPVLLLLAQLQAEQLPNWPSPFSYAALRPLLEEDGLPVAWVPRAELLQLWVDAPDTPTRRSLLVRHRDDVVEDCRTVLGEVVAADLQDARSLLRQAVDCVVAYPAPAQALALPAAATLAAEELGTSQLHELNKRLNQLATSGLPPVGQLQAHMTMLAVAPVLTTFRADRGDAVPERLNRHAVAHTIDKRQYSESNALQAVLLAVSVLRQAQANRDLLATADMLTRAQGPAGAAASLVL